MDTKNKFAAWVEENKEELLQKLIKETREDEDDPISERIQTIECELIIKKPDLLGESKWDMILDEVIPVKLEDKQFLSKIKEGEIKVSGGYKLICVMEMKTFMNTSYEAIRSPEYTIKQVKGVKNKEEQLEMSFN